MLLGRQTAKKCTKVQTNVRADSAATRMENHHLFSSTLLDRPKALIHYRLFVLIFYLNAPAHMRLRNCVGFWQRAFLSE